MHSVIGFNLHFISCVQGYLVYKNFWNPVVDQTLNCKHEAGSLCHRFTNPRYLRCLHSQFE